MRSDNLGHGALEYITLHARLRVLGTEPLDLGDVVLRQPVPTLPLGAVPIAPIPEIAELERLAPL